MARQLQEAICMPSEEIMARTTKLPCTGLNSTPLRMKSTARIQVKGYAVVGVQTVGMISPPLEKIYRSLPTMDICMR